MGKWTPTYRDQVLGEKIKSLVSGAIKRASLESGEPTISYDALVEDLDTGDSFTASLIDILVKELADRRSRTEETDRRLIALRTARSLNQLGISFTIYREPLPSQRPPNLSDYLNESTQETSAVEEDEDDFGSLLDTSGYTGAQALYDAYGPPRLRLPSRTLPPLPSVTPLPSFLDGNRFPPMPPIPQLPPPPSLPSLSFSSASPPARLPTPAAPRMANRRPSSLTASSSSSLHRQSSIRRASRARANEFSEFTSRRRSEARAVVENTEWSPLFDPSTDASSSTVTDPWADPEETSSSDLATGATGSSTRGPSNRTTGPYLSPPATHSRPGSPSIFDGMDLPEPSLRTDSPAPRLRRGGLPAPEVLFTSRFPDILNGLVIGGDAPHRRSDEPGL